MHRLKKCLKETDFKASSSTDKAADEFLADQRYAGQDLSTLALILRRKSENYSDIQAPKSLQNPHPMSHSSPTHYLRIIPTLLLLFVFTSASLAHAQRDGVYTNLKDALANKDEVLVLRLSNMNLKRLPANIGDLRACHTIEIPGNGLSTLPESFSELINLEKLTIADNNFTTIPDILCRLPKLKEIDASENQITTIPDCISGITTITELRLDKNKLSSLPDAIGDLQNLTVLRASNNEFSSIPTSLGRLAKLRELYFDDCKFTELPDAVCDLRSVKKLSLWNNQIATLPDCMGQMKRLKWLRLIGNPIAGDKKERKRLEKKVFEKDQVKILFE